MPAAPVWPFQANLTSRIVETYGYLTSVITSRKGDEQRVRLRKHPKGSISFEFFAHRSVDRWGSSILERSALIAAIYSNQPSKWTVPLWHYAVKLTSEATGGGTTLNVEDTTNSPFRTSTALGDYALVYAGPLNYEVVAMNLVLTSSISTLDPLVATWPKGAAVVPTRVGILAGGAQLRNVGPELVQGSVSFDFDMTESPAAGGPPPSEFIVMPGGGVVIPGG